MILVAIDPGLDGAMAFLEVSLPPIVFVMPTVKGEKRDQYDLQVIRGYLVGASHVFVEKLQPMPLKFRGSIANYQRGFGFGIVEGICAGLQVPCTAIPPKRWQKEMLAGIPGDDTKQRSILAAKKLFPAVDLRRTLACKKDDHGKADALLLAEYGRRMLR